uniref:Uncharacterized protein n=1 Tax=Arundo donax TaxID=35708 RepID=A0A0A9FQB0_ARUDO
MSYLGRLWWIGTSTPDAAAKASGCSSTC